MFFISSAQAQTTAAAGDPGLMSSLIMFGGLFIFMYLFIMYQSINFSSTLPDVVLGVSAYHLRGRT